MMKKKILFLLLLLSFILVGCDKKEETNNKEPQKVEEKQPEAPATDTEELITKSEKIEITSVSKNTIEFKETDKVKAGDKVAVWLYSKPKFLGYFDVIEENGVKKIQGLEEALKKVEVEAGDHNIAITTEKGESIGHVEIYIDETKEVFEEKPPVFTYKEVVETKEIAFKTTKKTNANLKKGTTKTIQKGSKGTKELIYKVKYDESGKEVSRELISEKVTKEAVDAIIETGASEFNLKTDKITGAFIGFACLTNNTFNYEGQISCNDFDETIPNFSATKIGSVVIVTNIGGTKLSTPVRVTKQSNGLYKGKYQGKDWYFDPRGGDSAPEELTEAKCKELNITCGTW